MRSAAHRLIRAWRSARQLHAALELRALLCCWPKAGATGVDQLEWPHRVATQRRSERLARRGGVRRRCRQTTERGEQTLSLLACRWQRLAPVNSGERLCVNVFETLRNTLQGSRERRSIVEEEQGRASLRSHGCHRERTASANTTLCLLRACCTHRLHGY